MEKKGEMGKGKLGKNGEKWEREKLENKSKKKVKNWGVNPIFLL
jgi:hypothetical protein